MTIGFDLDAVALVRVKRLRVMLRSSRLCSLRDYAVNSATMQLYQLIRQQKPITDRQFEIEFLDSGRGEMELNMVERI